MPDQTISIRVTVKGKACDFMWAAVFSDAPTLIQRKQFAHLLVRQMAPFKFANSIYNMLPINNN